MSRAHRIGLWQPKIPRTTQAEAADILICLIFPFSSVLKVRYLPAVAKSFQTIKSRRVKSRWLELREKCLWAVIQTRAEISIRSRLLLFRVSSLLIFEHLRTENIKQPFCPSKCERTEELLRRSWTPAHIWNWLFAEAGGNTINFLLLVLDLFMEKKYWTSSCLHCCCQEPGSSQKLKEFARKMPVRIFQQ